MGLPLAVALSLATDRPYLCIRKRRYDLPGEQVAYCETGYGQNCLYVNDLAAGDKVVVVDDVVSTGGTLSGLLATLTVMRVQVLAVLVFLDKGDAAARLAAQHGVPVRVMRNVRIEAGKVVRA
jgi:adenine phosphoribosyltransferase